MPIIAEAGIEVRKIISRESNFGRIPIIVASFKVSAFRYNLMGNLISPKGLKPKTSLVGLTSRKLSILT